MIDTLTISIPVDLASYAVWQRSLCRKYETNQVIKALDTWLLLKNDTRSSWIQDWNKQKTWLLKLCKISESIFRHRLRVLSDLKLIRYDRTGIRLCSWNQLERTFEIATDRKFTIQYNLNDKQRIQEWLIATEIRENQSRQAYKVNQKLNKNPELYRVFTDAIINAGADRNKLNDRSYFLQWLKILYHEDFIKASKIHAELIEVRPDTNRSVKGMANAWCYKAPQSVSYWKGILQKSGIIDVDKLQIRSTDRVRNKHCRVLWLKKDLQTLLCLCDQILVLEPWTIQKLIAA